MHESDGARVVFPSGFLNREHHPLGLILQKSDGGFGYAVTDLAALRSRTRDVGATRILYVVGLPQRQHLEMVFAVARAAGVGSRRPSAPSTSASGRSWAPLHLRQPAERALALDLLRFPAVSAELPRTLEFHHLAGYLYALATSVTTSTNSVGSYKPRLSSARAGWRCAS